MDTPEITNRLKAAEPTIVDAPSSPGHLFKPPTVSMHDSRISGALDPRAIKVKLATVGFQKSIGTYVVLPSIDFTATITFLDVIFSMASMKTSETMEIPKKR